MVAIGYSVLTADVIKRTERAALIRPADGPKAGEEVWVPISCFEEPEFVEVGDDEVVLANWLITKQELS